MSKIDQIDATFVPDPVLRLTERETALLRVISNRMDGLVRPLNNRLQQIDTELDIGNPGFGSIPQVKGNLAGDWASAVLTSGSLATFTHNLNLPVVPVPGQAYNQCNVTWLYRVIYGDRTGANAAPAAPAANVHATLFFRLGDAVTANSIELRVATGLTLSATTPLHIDCRFFPAVV